MTATLKIAFLQEQQAVCDIMQSVIVCHKTAPVSVFWNWTLFKYNWYLREN
jgi:hypothetical protein